MCHRPLSARPQRARFASLSLVVFLAYAAAAAAQLPPVEVAKLVGSDATALGGSGYSVAVDGDTAVVGTGGSFLSTGSERSAYVFARTGGMWIEQARLTAGDEGPGQFFLGVQVAVSGDTAVVSGLTTDPTGEFTEVRVFTRAGSVWTQQATLTPSDGMPRFFGSAVALLGDTAVIGASGDAHAGDVSGSTYVFTRSEGEWTQQAKLTASDAAARDAFGGAVALSGDTVVIGADHFTKSGTGAAYVFTRSDAVWTEQAKLTASDAATGDLFGRSVTLSGDTAVVGAPGNDDASENSGSAYVFTRINGEWLEHAKLAAADAAAGDRLGQYVAVSGDRALIGAPGDDDTGEGSGAAYALTRSGGEWLEQAKLTAGDAAMGDAFGFAVAVSSDTSLIGAPWQDDAGENSGAAYIFDNDGYAPDSEGERDVPVSTGENQTVIELDAFLMVASNVLAPLDGSDPVLDFDYCVARDIREAHAPDGPSVYTRRALPVSQVAGTGSCTGDLQGGPTDLPNNAGTVSTWEELLAKIDLVVPAWNRTFRGDFDGVDGFWFVIASVRTNVEFDGPILVKETPEVFPGLVYDDLVPDTEEDGNDFDELACNATLTKRPSGLAGLVTAFGEWPNVERNLMIKSTYRCNRPETMTRRTHHVYPVRHDGVFVDQKAGLILQLAGIGATLQEAMTCAAAGPSGVGSLQSMRVDLLAATAAALLNQWSRALMRLESIAVKADATTFSSSDSCVRRNYKGNLVGRGLTGAFTVWDSFLHPTTAGWEVYHPPEGLAPEPDEP